MKFIENIQAAYGEDARVSDRGDLVQNILMIAGFAIVTILVVNWIGTAVMNKGVDTARCIEGSSAYNANPGDAEAACKGNVAKDQGKTFEKDKGFESRYNN